MAQLTAKQEKFAELYAESRNGAASYFAAYECGADTKSQTIYSEASRLLADRKVAARINELIEASAAVNSINLQKLQRLFLDLALSDPNELIGLRIGCCRFCHGERHGYQWREREYLEALGKWERLRPSEQSEKPMPDIGGGFGFDHTAPPRDDCPECKGEGVDRVVPRDTRFLSPGARLLYGGVKAKKDGLEIILGDRQKALENVARILGAYKDKVSVTGVLATAQAVIDAPDAATAAKLYQEMVAAIAVD